MAKSYPKFVKGKKITDARRSVNPKQNKYQENYQANFSQAIENQNEKKNIIESSQRKMTYTETIHF